MKKYNLKITPLAEQDLTNIGDYIALELKNPSAALNTIKGIRQIILPNADNLPAAQNNAGIADGSPNSRHFCTEALPKAFALPGWAT